MEIVITSKAKKDYDTLEKRIQKKFDKQLMLLASDLRHPSLRARKLAGLLDVWEGRIDKSYRFLFIIEDNSITILRAGPHDEGLGKK